MLKRSALAGLVAFLPLLAACGGSDLTVVVLSEAEGVQVPVANQEIVFIPFNRDSVFEALAAAAEEPEPQIPSDLEEQFAQVAALQEDWRVAEAEWAEARESLQNLSDRLQRLDRRSREYQQLYRQFDGLEGTERRLNNARQQAFQVFDDLQKQSLTRSDSIRAVIEAWEDIAFMDYVDIETEILTEDGRQIMYDTTDASGAATSRLKSGSWYVHTRLPRPFSELYWNVLIDPSATDSLQLTTANADERIRL
jgi:predicted metal-dependent hydrolase